MYKNVRTQLKTLKLYTTLVFAEAFSPKTSMGCPKKQFADFFLTPSANRDGA